MGTQPLLGTRHSHAEWNRRPQKGGRGLKGLLETFRKTSLQEMSWTQLQKKNRQPAAAGRACQGRGAKQRVGWTFLRLACLSSPPLDLKSKYFATRRWPPAVEGVVCTFFLQCEQGWTPGSGLSPTCTQQLQAQAVGLPLIQSISQFTPSTSIGVHSSLLAKYRILSNSEVFKPCFLHLQGYHGLFWRWQGTRQIYCLHVCVFWGIQSLTYIFLCVDDSKQILIVIYGLN